jgi:hypothetical protein
MTDAASSRFYMPRQYAPTPTGAPMPGARLYFYQTQSTVPQDTFSDATLSTPNTNPVEADDNGLFGPIFLQSLEYRVVWTDANGDEIATDDPVAPFSFGAGAGNNTIIPSVTFGGDGSPVVAASTGDDYVPINCTIQSVVVQADVSGSIQLDIWVRDFLANTPPTVVNSIVASLPPKLVGAQSAIFSTLTGWVTNIPAGSAIRYNVTSTGGVIQRCTMSLICSPA